MFYGDHGRVAGMAEVRLRSAEGGELAGLSELALRSKGYWGYDEAFLEACRAELTMTPERLASETVVVATGGPEGAVLGYSSIVAEPFRAELMDLFVEPAWIGTGVGAILLARARADASLAGAHWLDIEADPFAAAWYRRRGARDIGTISSGSISGRTLPLLRIDLAATAASGR